ncbi:MAG: hypothetical protein IT335_03665 [Thermomicrobiales bacterium]|nr:hypothetical protein [Thermomicrobiales bacterium]
MPAPVNAFRNDTSHQADALRLDRLVNPFAPPPAVRSVALPQGDPSMLLEKVKTTIAARLGIAAQVVFPVQAVDGFLGAIDADRDSVRSETVYVSSPDMTTGRLLTVTQGVRLARSCRQLIIDERAGGFVHRDHLPLFREFENVILLRSFDTWIEPAGGRSSYLIAKRPPAALGDVPDALSLATTLATLADDVWVEAAIRQTARERVRLMRALRKLNMVRPLPSAAGFVAARVERGDRESLRAFLEERRIVLHYPAGDDHADLIRISAVSAAATSAVASALIDWALTLDS